MSTNKLKELKKTIRKDVSVVEGKGSLIAVDEKTGTVNINGDAPTSYNPNKDEKDIDSLFSKPVSGADVTSGDGPQRLRPDAANFVPYGPPRPFMMPPYMFRPGFSHPPGFHPHFHPGHPGPPPHGVYGPPRGHPYGPSAYGPPGRGPPGFHGPPLHMRMHPGKPKMRHHPMNQGKPAPAAPEADSLQPEPETDAPVDKVEVQCAKGKGKAARQLEAFTDTASAADLPPAPATKPAATTEPNRKRATKAKANSTRHPQPQASWASVALSQPQPQSHPEHGDASALTAPAMPADGAAPAWQKRDRQSAHPTPASAPAKPVEASVSPLTAPRAASAAAPAATPEPPAASTTEEGFTVVDSVPCATEDEDDGFMIVMPTVRTTTLSALTSALRKDVAAVTAPIVAGNRSVVSLMAADQARADAELLVTARAARDGPRTIGERVYMAAGVDSSMVPSRLSALPVGAVMSDVSETAIAASRAEQRRLEDAFLAEMRAEYEAYVARVIAEQERHNQTQAASGASGDGDADDAASIALARQLAIAEGTPVEEINQWQQPGSARERAARERAIRDSMANKLRSLRKRVKRDGVEKVREELAAEKAKAEMEQPKDSKRTSSRISESSRFGALMSYDDSDDSDTDA